MRLLRQAYRPFDRYKFECKIMNTPVAVVLSSGHLTFKGLEGPQPIVTWQVGQDAERANVSKIFRPPTQVWLTLIFISADSWRSRPPERALSRSPSIGTFWAISVRLPDMQIIDFARVGSRTPAAVDK
jgi:hypothetical protein